MIVDLPREAWLLWWSVLGLFVGSFLNVAIHRLPLEDETVSKPRRSRCPSCKTTLTWRDNVPLLSWLALRGRCRTCGWRIPWRYPLVEALNAGLWLLAAWWTLPERFDLCLVQSVVLSGLVVATFVDFACYQIPDEVSKGGMWLAPLATLLVPDLHATSWVAHVTSGAGAEGVTRAGALFSCFAGMAVGGGILWGIGALGSAIYKKDAMGFGDVKLLAAAGGFVGPGAVVGALLIGSVLASVVGVLNWIRLFTILRLRARDRRAAAFFGAGTRQSLVIMRLFGQYLPFGPYLAVGIGIVLLDWNDVVRLLQSSAIWPR